MADMTNPQVALQAASLVHQRVAAGSGAAAGGNTYSTSKGELRDFTARPSDVLDTADVFLKWLRAREAQ